MSVIPPKPVVDPPPDPVEDPPTPRTFSQEDVNRIMAKEKREGKTAGTKEILEQLGVETVEEAQAALTKIREADDAMKSEADRAAEQAKADRAAAAKEKADAAKDRQVARIERTLSKLGIPDEEIETVAEMVKVPDDADADAVTAAVEALKEKMPRLFEAPDPAKKPPVKGDPGNPPRPPVPKDASGTAHDLLAERHGKKLKSATP